MKILGVDFGRAKIGLALGDTNSRLADPLRVIRYQSPEDVLEKIAQIVESEQIEKIVVGVADGKVAKQSREFGNQLQVRTHTPVIFQDETLTTLDAQKLSIEAGIKRGKRRKLEDAYSAALILQTWLDS